MMVTILEPREVVPAEPAQAPEAAGLRQARPLQWGFSISLHGAGPCAGVKYYSFRPAEKPQPAPGYLKAKLIDERVILL